MTKSAKIHIAGKLVGDVQVCVRCHSRIDHNPTWQPIFGGSPTGWKEGAEVYSDRGGMSVVEGDKYAGVRPCGKAK